MAGSAAGTGEAVEGVDAGSAARNPLLCSVCHDYYSEPCLLQCYHTFCARCLRGPHLDGKVSCPICGQTTLLKDGAQQPPADQLMRQLVEFANSENPACANCDKRDKTSMFFCTTCGQALCTHCREHTHRAKMFSSHEVVHMSKCSKDTQRRCPSHGEQNIMFSQSTKSLLCASCFRDTAPEARLHCVDVDTAWQQASKKMERAANSICELQAAVHNGLLELKAQSEELRRSLETEQRAINGYCQSVIEAVNKAHSSLLAELHREFDAKERTLRGQLLALGSALPVLQMHLGLCTAFTSAASKYQFLELAHPMLERLGRVAQLGHLPRPPLLTAHLTSNYQAEMLRVLQPFVAPAAAPKESDAHFAQPTEPALQPPPPPRQKPKQGPCEAGRFNSHCRAFDSQLQELSGQLKTVRERLGELHRDVALLRRANTPPLGSRYENVARDCRLLDQQLEHQQLELERLRGVFDALWEEQLCRIHLEKEVFHSQMNDILSLKAEVKQLQAVAQQLEPFVKSFSAGVSAGEVSVAAADAAGHQHLQALLDHLARLQMQEPAQPQMPAPTKEFRQQRGGQSEARREADSKEAPTRCRTPSGGVEAVLDSSGNIVVYGTKPEAKRGVLSQLIEKARPERKEDRRKSPGREEGRDRSQTRRSRKSPEGGKPKTPPGHSSASKVRSLYRSLKGGGGGGGGGGDEPSDQQRGGGVEECEYQRISEASSLGEAKKRVQAQVHAAPAKGVKVYPASDSEDVFYAAGEKASSQSRERRRRRASCDSLSTTGSGSRRSSITEGTVGLSAQDARKTLVFLIGSSPTSSSLVQKQRSWETFPRPKSKRGGHSAGSGTPATAALGQLKKADSFEGHEEAVRTLVAAVQETRSQLRQHHLHQHRYHRKSKTN